MGCLWQSFGFLLAESLMQRHKTKVVYMREASQAAGQS